jgi:Leucine-rich repeat (LRR) protein
MVFRQSNRLKFIIITLIHCLIHCDERHVCNASVITDSDICEFETGQKVYCNCDNSGVNEARQVTCFTVSTEGLTPTASVWNRFRLQRNITSLVITTRFDSKLSFLPVRALRNIADSLETLNINEMSLGVLESYSMSNFSKLSKIALESNEIRGLNESSFAHLPALKVISLSSNSIGILKSNVFVDLPKLEELFLDRNELTTIEDNAFIHLKHLREIDLRLNRINTITALTFWGLSHLKRLDLSRNQLKVIPSFAFTGAPLLRELDLNKNQIITIEDNAFHNLSHLMSLQLNENKITYLSTTLFKSSPQLAFIDLSNNDLETFERELIENLEHLKQEQFVIYLKGKK